MLQLLQYVDLPHGIQELWASFCLQWRPLNDFQGELLKSLILLTEFDRCKAALPYVLEERVLIHCESFLIVDALDALPRFLDVEDCNAVECSIGRLSLKSRPFNHLYY